MENKEKYKAPEIEWVKIAQGDVISTSGGNNNINPDLGENDGEWL